MINDWEKDIPSLSYITVHAQPNNAPVQIKGDAPQLTCMGVGTDAAVFRSTSAPQYVYKVYAQEEVRKAAIEAAVYAQLGDAPYFATCVAATDTFLVLSYEPGKTLYHCLLEGIHIPKSVIEDVEEARDYIRSKGLNPRDIHLKNIVLQNGKAKILDVSEYVVDGNDFRWDYLKQGYAQYYHYIDGNRVPLRIVQAVQNRFNEHRGNSYSYEEFAKTWLRLLLKK
ncbi:serine/threonine protein kinase [Caryophanon tenue]|uniref:Serine/threonine protein kinase n=1 Tax=Caryophanon tenue TaxID=33978 RepID=A0A1C0YBK8_9BACL|nr:serine/threonine protein kinase [Caryophanon tenue]OCS84577.1 serine/threonine protein kinase [Caryophanon tenue]